jgi:hypothetical protein
MDSPGAGVAVALRVIVPDTNPAAGEVITTVGAFGGGGALPVVNKKFGGPYELDRMPKVAYPPLLC